LPRAQARDDHGGERCTGAGQTRTPVITVIIAAVIVYAAYHLGAGHTHHRYRKAHGLQPRVYRSLGRGSYGSVRLPGGFRVGHKL
jgi:hypothetical protein